MTDSPPFGVFIFFSLMSLARSSRIRSNSAEAGFVRRVLRRELALDRHLEHRFAQAVRQRGVQRFALGLELAILLTSGMSPETRSAMRRCSAKGGTGTRVFSKYDKLYPRNCSS